MAGTKPPPSGFGVQTPARKAARTKKGRSRSHVPPSRWTTPTKKVASSLPPLTYGNGPYTLQIEDYLFRLWGIRGDLSDTVLLTEVETLSWDDASAVLTGSLTFRFPDWADKIGLREGHEIRCEAAKAGDNYTPLWTMRIDQPNSDLTGRQRTANLVSDLNRMAQSTDSFVFAKSKARPRGWRVDEVIRSLCAQYGFDVAECPVMTAYITNWHLTDQHPIDVIHSALIREKNVTGRKYAVTMDWRKRVHITSFRRPTTLWEIGPQMIAATLSAQHDPRFATALTVRSDPVASVAVDKKGHRKPATTKVSVAVRSPSGVKLYGYIHRNVYSPDAKSIAAAQKEGKLFLAAVAKPKRQFTVTLPGLPSLRRLDAFRVSLPTEGVNQIVYVSDARHSLDSSSGYTVEAVLDFDDPFVDDKSQKILAKLSDVAVTRTRKAPATPTKKKKTTTKTGQARSTKKPSGFGVTTQPREPRATRR